MRPTVSRGNSVAPKTRPRPYVTLDRAFLAQDTIADLGERFGPAGPLVFLAIVLDGGYFTTALPRGVVELRYRALEREAFTPEEKVREIVAAIVEVGLLDEFEDMGGGRFRARLAKFDRWESQPMTGAERTAAYRARHAQDDVTS